MRVFDAHAPHLHDDELALSKFLEGAGGAEAGVFEGFTGKALNSDRDGQPYGLLAELAVSCSPLDVLHDAPGAQQPDIPVLRVAAGGVKQAEILL